MKELYPDGFYPVAGEIYEGKKRDKEKDIGQIDLAETRLPVSPRGQNSRLLRKEAAYLSVGENSYLTVLKLRLMPLILLALLLIALLLFALLRSRIPQLSEAVTQEVETTVAETAPPVSIAPLSALTYTVSGMVNDAFQPVEGAELSLQKGNKEISSAVTDKDGNYAIYDVPEGYYNLVCNCDGSVLTQLVEIEKKNVEAVYYFPSDDLSDLYMIPGLESIEPLPEEGSDPTVKSIIRANVALSGEKTPAIAVGNLDINGLLSMEYARESNYTFSATQLEESEVPEEEVAAIKELSGQTELTWLDFSVTGEIISEGVTEKTQQVSEAREVMEIVVPFDSSSSEGVYLFRYHDGKAVRFEELEEKPEAPEDATYYVASNVIHIYANQFSLYAIGSAEAGSQRKGFDSISYTKQITVDTATKMLTMLYEHGSNGTNDAIVEVYIKGREEDLLIACSDTVPPGNRLTELPLLIDVSQLPAPGSYQGIMRIIYISEGQVIGNQLDFVVTVTIN